MVINFQFMCARIQSLLLDIIIIIWLKDPESERHVEISERGRKWSRMGKNWMIFLQTGFIVDVSFDRRILILIVYMQAKATHKTLWYHRAHFEKTNSWRTKKNNDNTETRSLVAIAEARETHAHHTGNIVRSEKNILIETAEHEHESIVLHMIAPKKYVYTYPS